MSINGACRAGVDAVRHSRAQTPAATRAGDVGPLVFQFAMANAWTLESLPQARDSRIALRSCAPGEWSKLLGLDRVPEVRTLCEEIGLLLQGARTGKGSADLRWRRMALIGCAGADHRLPGHPLQCPCVWAARSTD